MRMNEERGIVDRRLKDRLTNRLESTLQLLVDESVILTFSWFSSAAGLLMITSVANIDSQLVVAQSLVGGS